MFQACVIVLAALGFVNLLLVAVVVGLAHLDLGVWSFWFLWDCLAGGAVLAATGGLAFMVRRGGGGGAMWLQLFEGLW